MGFRSRARARRQERMNVLGSKKDYTEPAVDNGVLSSSENDSDDSTILGVVEPVIETPAVAPPEAEKVEAKASDVPEGTSNEVKDWVGEDVDRARVALEVESASDKPRKGLVSHLEGMLNE